MNTGVFLRAIWVAAAASIFMVGNALAADKGTRAEAEAMVKKAVAYIKANGEAAAFEEFNRGTSFKDRDLFIIVNRMDGTSLAHGANNKLVGKNLMEFKDADGRPFVKIMTELLNTKSKAWSEDFRFLNPVSQKLEIKNSYLERVGDIYVGCGIYKD